MRAAFFDVDGTLASSNVVSCYAHVQLHNRGRLSSLLWVLRFLPNIPYLMLMDRLDRFTFSRRFFHNYRNVTPLQLQRWMEDAGSDYWRRHLQPEALRRVESHRQQGDLVILASGGVEESLVPLMHLLSSDHVICARLEQHKARFTGTLESGPIVGQAKADAVERLAGELGLDRSECYAYSDSYSDREFLESVGYPITVNPDRALRRLAESRGWPVLDWRSNGTAQESASA